MYVRLFNTSRVTFSDQLNCNYHTKKAGVRKVVVLSSTAIIDPGTGSANSNRLLTEEATNTNTSPTKQPYIFCQREVERVTSEVIDNIYLESLSINNQQ